MFLISSTQLQYCLCIKIRRLQSHQTCKELIIIVIELAVYIVVLKLPFILEKLIEEILPIFF